ncbi:MAG: hypothetical protein KKF44_01320 [Nanoarchaeota archaeon]|nr:hypothetical protein [Nanoarchaeota archaeon]
MMLTIKKRTLYSLLVVICLISGLYTLVYAAEPEGGNVIYKSNSTKNVSAATSRNDTKGTITTIVIEAITQNYKWKAYVGNVTGTLVLRDSSSYSIYEWTSIGNPSGVVYITRNNSITWSDIKCANSTLIDTEDTYLNHSSTAQDNINFTFSNTAHDSFWVGDIAQIANSSCRSIATWVNNTVQTQNEDALFQEVLLSDDNNLIYATILEQDADGYRDDNSTYDFQALVADSALPGEVDQVTYYFYVEISTG